MKFSGIVTRGNYFFRGLFWALLILLAPANSWAFPASIQIHGVLVDSSNAPLTGIRKCQVRFFDAATSGTQLGTTQATAANLSSHGEFNIYVLMPDDAIKADRVWYELAIDSEKIPDGDPTNNIFPRRVEIQSVPFALYAYGLAGKIGAAQVADGSVGNAEFQRLNGVKSNIQLQIDTKANQLQVDASQAAQDVAIASHTLHLAAQDLLLTTHSQMLTSYGRRLDIDWAMLLRHASRLAGHDTLLTSHTNELAAHDALLTSHSQIIALGEEIMNSYGRRLDLDRAMLLRHASRLAGHDALLTSHTNELAAHDALLTSHSQIIALGEEIMNSYGRRLDVDRAMLLRHASRLAGHDALLTSHTNELALHDALLTSHTNELAAHDLLLTSHTSQLELKMDADNVYTKAQIDAAKAIFDASQAAQDVLISSHTEAFRRDEALLAGHAEQLAQKMDADDAYTKSEIDASQLVQDTAIAAKADAANVYSRAHIDNLSDNFDEEQDDQNDMISSHTLAFRRDEIQLADHTHQLALKMDAANAYTKSQIDASQSAQDTAIAAKASAVNVYTKAEVDASQSAQNTTIAGKADATSVYTKSQIDTSQSAQDTAIAAKADAASVYTMVQSDARFAPAGSGGAMTTPTLQAVTDQSAITNHDIEFSGDTQYLFHTGNTGLEILSYWGYVKVNNVNFYDKYLGTPNNWMLMSFDDNSVGIFTTTTLGGGLNAMNGALYVDSSNGRVGVGNTAPAARFCVDNSVGTLSSICVGGTASASNTYRLNGATGYEASNAFDGNTWNEWSTVWDDQGLTGDQWLEYDFGAGKTKTVTGYRLYQMAYGQNNTTFKFQASNDHSAWTDLDSQSGQDFTTMKTYLINNQTAYRYYRIFFPDASKGRIVHMAEMEMFDYIHYNLVTAGTPANPGLVGINKTAPKSNLDISGSLALSIRSVSASLTLTASDYTVIVKNPITVTLPAASSAPGRVYVIKRYPSVAGTVTLAPQAGEKLDGVAASMNLAGSTSYTVQSDGTEWYLIAS